jgi:hypothetical protein
MVMSLRHGSPAVTACWDGTELFRYTYLPSGPQLESPRPYFHPVRTLGGDLVSLYRPHDHVWHRGIAWSLPNAGTENFWGGPTYRRGDGYVQLSNNGTIRHESFELTASGSGLITSRSGQDTNSPGLGGGVPGLGGGGPGLVGLDERLSWVTEAGQTVIAERRRIGATVWPADSAWLLAFETTMTNVAGQDLRFGSPTTEGRDNAGYGGLFWRGPRSFTGGRVLAPDGAGGDELMGRRGQWLAYAGRHDEHGRWSTLIFRDAPQNFSHPSQWFVRSTPFACLCPAPFFAAEYRLGAGASLTLRYDVAVADGELDPAACARLAARAGEHDVLASEE